MTVGVVRARAHRYPDGAIAGHPPLGRCKSTSAIRTAALARVAFQNSVNVKKSVALRDLGEDAAQ